MIIMIMNANRTVTLVGESTENPLINQNKIRLNNFSSHVVTICQDSLKFLGFMMVNLSVCACYLVFKNIS